MVMDGRDDITKEVHARIDKLKWIKLVGLGSLAAGKTCLIKYFCENKFAPGYQPTVGVDYGFKIQTVNREDIRVHLWDLSGSDEYYDTRIELYGKTDGVFIVYDVTNQSSFDNLSHWLDEVHRFCASPSPVLMLCASKIDLKAKRVITKEKGEAWAKSHKMAYYEVSSATGENVEAMYEAMLVKILARR